MKQKQSQNRIIKFRLWDFEQKAMHFSNDGWIGDIDCLKEVWEYLNDGDYQIMQYVGLNDTTGRKIYEGDILEYDERDIGGFHGLGEVFYCTDMTLVLNPGFGIWTHKLLSRDNLKEGQSGIGYGNFPMNAKVVGNIYENFSLFSAQN